jgi:hypothetical protein
MLLLLVLLLLLLLLVHASQYDVLLICILATCARS